MVKKVGDFQADLFDEFGIDADSKTKSEPMTQATRSSDAITPEFTVSEATAIFNQVFETATPSIKIVGEVANFKINQGKWVFFDIKDDESSLGCFMSAWQLRVAIENGMRVAVVARPQITKWGKFSLTVQSVRPVGVGSIKRAFDLLRDKLAREGLFDESRKRALPYLPAKIGVVSSVDAAGFKDFVKIIGERMGGMEIIVAHAQVQGDAAADQIVGALKYLNGSTDVDVIAILRGGGSRDDLVAFDDEKVVREIAASRIPTIVGVGHEIDTTLADLAADVRASTPSNAAEIIVPDRREIVGDIKQKIQEIFQFTYNEIEQKKCSIHDELRGAFDKMSEITLSDFHHFDLLNAALLARNPELILRRGYAVLRNSDGSAITTEPKVGDDVSMETSRWIIGSKISEVKVKNRRT